MLSGTRTHRGQEVTPSSTLQPPYLPARVGPGAKLHLAPLVVEGEPGDVNLTRRLEDARRNVEAVAVGGHYYLRLVGPVEALVGTGERWRLWVAPRGVGVC